MKKLISLLKWIPDFAAEELFDELNLKWEIQILKINDVVKSMKSGDFNPTRTTGIDPEHVEQMRLDMQKGRGFPRPVLIFDEKNYFLVSGYHRLDAAEKEKQTMAEFYIIRSDDEGVRLRLMHGLNIRHGKNLNREERKVFAMNLVDHLNYSVKDAARIMGLSPTNLSDSINARSTKLKLIKSGVPSASVKRMTNSHLTAIGTLKNAIVQKELAEFVSTHDLGVVETQELSRQVRSKDTEKSMLDVIEKQKKQTPVPLPGVTRKRNKNPAIKLQIDALTKTLSGVSSLSQLEITSEKDRKHVQNKAKNLVELMDRVIFGKSKK